MSINTSFTSPLANAHLGGNVPPPVDYVLDALKGVTFWTGFWTLLALAIVYDQRTLGKLPGPIGLTSNLTFDMQSVISGTRAPLLVPAGRFRLWAHSSSQ